jgi:hypothetical protein
LFFETKGDKVLAANWAESNALGVEIRRTVANMQRCAGAKGRDNDGRPKIAGENGQTLGVPVRQLIPGKPNSKSHFYQTVMT